MCQHNFEISRLSLTDSTFRFVVKNFDLITVKLEIISFYPVSLSHHTQLLTSSFVPREDNDLHLISWLALVKCRKSV